MMQNARKQISNQKPHHSPGRRFHVGLPWRLGCNSPTTKRKMVYSKLCTLLFGEKSNMILFKCSTWDKCLRPHAECKQSPFFLWCKKHLKTIYLCNSEAKNIQPFFSWIFEEMWCDMSHTTAAKVQYKSSVRMKEIRIKECRYNSYRKIINSLQNKILFNENTRKYLNI